MNYNNAKFHTSYGKFEQIPPCDRAEIAFSGRSNVGKSSLINKVFNRKKSRAGIGDPRKDRDYQLLRTGKYLYSRSSRLWIRESIKSGKAKLEQAYRRVSLIGTRAFSGISAYRFQALPHCRRCFYGELSYRLRISVRCRAY